MVTYVGLSGFFCGVAVELGKSTGRSTVESGAAIMKMISSTSMTSMNGVTLISCASPKSSSSFSLTDAPMLVTPASLRGARHHAAAAIEVARQQAADGA